MLSIALSAFLFSLFCFLKATSWKLPEMNSRKNEFPVEIKTPRISSEIAINNFIRQFKSRIIITDDDLSVMFEVVVKATVIEDGETSVVHYNRNLARSLISSCDFDQLKKTNASEYTIRKYLQEVVNLYIQSASKSRPIIVRDKTLFGIKMKAYGINVGFTSETSLRQLIPDGNVLTVMIGLFLITAVVIYKSNT